MTPLTRSTLLVVLLWNLWCCEQKMSYAPNASCRLVQKVLVRRVQRSKTSMSGSPAQNTEETILRVQSRPWQSSWLEQPDAARQEVDLAWQGRQQLDVV